MNLDKPNIIYHDKFFIYDDVLLNRSILKYILDIICIKNVYIESLRIRELGEFHLYEFGISLYRGKLKNIGISRKLKFLKEVNYKAINFDNKRVYIVLKPCTEHFNFVFNFIMVLEANSKKKVPFNLVVNRLSEILDAGNFIGYKFCIKGKYSKENIKKTVTKGKIPLNTISESIVFYMHFINTRYGLFGVKLYLNITKKDNATILKENKRKKRKEKKKKETESIS
uniref:Small ribosomal protein 3 n=1 Tax=Pilostyles aethiopica TaxID=301899 RepID=A0A0U3A8I3_9ROSI|nr:small ribosomal protein 3 [Pilostyles aethiopica]ALT22437.1 small ribosomal protein 3 [Pilostyles aethiopica]